MISLDVNSGDNRYVEVFCLTIPREKFAYEYLLKLEKEGKVAILEKTEYNTPKGHYFVKVEFECSGSNPVQDLMQSFEDELEEEE